MSHHSLNSDWATLESGTFRFRDPTNKERRFIPLRVDDTEIKETLKQFAFVDWRHKLSAEYEKLKEACLAGRRNTGTQDPIIAHQILEHGWPVYAVAFGPDGHSVVSGCDDRKIWIWDLASGKSRTAPLEHKNAIYAIAIASNARKVISGARDSTVGLWDLDSLEHLAVLEGHNNPVNGVAVTADAKLGLSASDDHYIRVWDLRTGRCLFKLRGHSARIIGIAISPDGKTTISGSLDRTVRVWDLGARACVKTLAEHARGVNGVAITPDGRRALSASDDATVRLWDLETQKCLAVLEGHTQPVYAVAVTPDGRIAASGSLDHTVRVWDLSSGKCLNILKGHTSQVTSVALTSDGNRVASASWDTTVRVWDIPKEPSPKETEKNTTRYTNAKVLIVGDSGVGKTGLAHRLTENVFRESISTDAAWATQMKLPNASARAGIEHEIWLWDFAGQADYRLIHQLFMDETALAVLVFSPQSETPFEGLAQWNRDLQRAARRPFEKVLVAGRCDRGGLMVSREAVEAFRKECGFTDYIETSALVGTGCDRLRETIIGRIPWDEIPWTASPRIFRLLKDEIVKMKDEGVVLLRMIELRQQLELRLPKEDFTFEQLRAVVGLLAGPGVVWQLEFGDFVVLRPEWINVYAAALIRSVRAHYGEIGVILEQDVLAGNLNYTVDRRPSGPDEEAKEPEPAQPKAESVRRLPPQEEAVILRAMHQTFVDHGLCLREHTEAGTQLIFPSYFRRELPKDPGHPPVLVSYTFNGNANDIYATLVVQLHHTKAFSSGHLWRYAADFKTHNDKRMGLMMCKSPDGAAEISVYFESRVAEDTQVTFIKYVHEHLLAKAQSVKRLRHYVCEHCSTPVENRQTALDRLNSGKKDILCVNCEQRILLWDLVEQKFASAEFQQRVRELEELAVANIDNESKDLILRGHAFVIAGESGQIYREYSGSDHGIDGEIEFKDGSGKPSGQRVYLQLKSGDSYLYHRKDDGAEIFTIKNERHAQYWQQQAYPVMLVIRTSDGTIRWMDVSEYLRRHTVSRRPVKQVLFTGEALTALNVRRLREKFITSRRSDTDRNAPIP